MFILRETVTNAITITPPIVVVAAEGQVTRKIEILLLAVATALLLTAAVVLVVIVGGVLVTPKSAQQTLQKTIAFEVKSIEIVDHNGNAAVKIIFSTSKYPIDFYILTADGEKVYYVTVDAPESVAYLHLTPYGYTNIIGERAYVIKAYYLGEEVWNKTIVVKGVKPEIEVVEVSAQADYHYLYLLDAVLKIRNLGDMPLYITSENLAFYLDGDKRYIIVERTIIMPNDEKLIRVSLSKEFITYTKIDSAEIDREHVLEFVVANARAKYVIPPAKVELSIVGESTDSCCGYITEFKIYMRLINRWTYPINVNWIRVYKDGTKISVTWTPTDKPREKGVVEPGEVASFMTYLYYCKLNSVIDFYFAGTKLATIKCS